MKDMQDCEDIERLKDEARLSAELSRFMEILASSGLINFSEKATCLHEESKQIFAPLKNTLGRRGEDKSCALFDYAILGGVFDKQLHQEVVLSRKEYRLKAGRIDRLLEHKDGSFTVVEIKPNGSLRDQAQGLGQSILYAASLRAELRDNREVRSALFISGDFDQEIESACRSVGVEYLYFPYCAQRLVDELAEIHNAK